ncbi:MAG: M20/M25/M40 family metallo-hydrolase, partial [Candidatus Thermoplasmatota archaeon]|nr:M20/M25/M40 family metallo-hydrolase [Candidatus Thermoplasmatota archaeon]
MPNPKSAIFAFALVFLLALSAFSGCLNEDGLNFARQGADLFDMEANLISGAICNISVQSSTPNATIVMPPGVLAFAGGALSTNSTMDFTGASYNFQALFPPNVSSFEFVVSDGKSEENFTFNSTEGTYSGAVPSGKEIFDRVKYITSMYPLRVTHTPTHLALQLYLVQTLQSFGLDVHWTPADGAGTGEFPLNIVAYHWGADKSRWIGMGAHTDTITTIEGAYDNAAGTGTVLELARVISQYKFDKTIVFGFWGAEEEGDVGSAQFAQNMPADAKMDYYFNFDMVGINWPGPKGNPTPLKMFARHDDAQVTKQAINFAKYVVYEACRYPQGNNTFKIVKDTMGSSDHVSFADVGVPAFKIFGAKENYPAYHTPDDTFDTMVAF